QHPPGVFFTGKTHDEVDRVAYQKRTTSQPWLHEIGMILAYVATRLARNCTHWYQLLDLCGHAGCLIADRDGVYDPGSVTGRLLLDLKGAISELETFSSERISLSLPCALDRSPYRRCRQRTSLDPRPRSACRRSHRRK